MANFLLPVSKDVDKRVASSPRTLAKTFWGEFGPPKRAPPNLENRADSPPLRPSDDATVF